MIRSAYFVIGVGHIRQCNGGDGRLAEIRHCPGNRDCDPGLPILQCVAKPPSAGDLEGDERYKDPEAHFYLLVSEPLNILHSHCFLTWLVDTIIPLRQLENQPIANRPTDQCTKCCSNKRCNIHQSNR